MAKRTSYSGPRLIETGTELARRLGAPQLEWSTAPDNHRAQRLYDSTGAEKSSWLIYELPVGSSLPR